MKVLVLYDDNTIHAWLTNEPLESVESHITNGYPHLMEDYKAGRVKAEVIEVPDEIAYEVDKFIIQDGKINYAREA